MKDSKKIYLFLDIIIIAIQKFIILFLPSPPTIFQFDEKIAKLENNIPSGKSKEPLRERRTYDTMENVDYIEIDRKKIVLKKKHIISKHVY